MKYKIRIEETLSKDVIVEAESPEEATLFVKQNYDDGEIVLTADDFVGYAQFTFINEEDK